MNQSIQDLLHVYLGENAGESILKGTLNRGQSISIVASIMIADLRGSTVLIERLGAQAYIDMLNGVYDVIVPPIFDRGGEVLAFTGDGLLAVWEESPEAKAESKVCPVAVENAYLATVAAAAACRQGDADCSLGFGLSYGSVDYADVGTTKRRSMTVIGSQISLADRLQRLCPITGSDVAMSDVFASNLHGHETKSVGMHDLKGFSSQIEVFVPSSRQ